MLHLPPVRATHQLSTFDRQTNTKTIPVPRGRTVTVGQGDGPGYLAKLWLTFPGWFWPHWDPNVAVDQSILKTLILRIYFDDSAEPQVAAPMGDLFGAGLCEITSFAAEYFGMSSGGFYCGFPMPFRHGFRIEIENRDDTVDTDVFLNAIYQSVDELPDGTPYFHGFFTTGRNSGPDPLDLGTATGPGKYVGCTLSCQGEPMNYLSYLEAPEHIYVDGDWNEPRIVGTGMEDYFLGGWYFREGPFTGPHHGVPIKDSLRSSTAMYRVHELDAIHFRDRFRLTFQSPLAPERLRPFAYSAVSFYYLQPAAAPALPPRDDLLVWYRRRDTDHQAIP